MTMEPNSAGDSTVLSYRPVVVAGDLEARLVAHGSLRSLGMLCCFFGFGFIALGMIFLFTSWEMIGHDPSVLILAAPFVALASFGVTYWICGLKVLRGSRTAAFIALVLAALQLCGAAAVCVVSFLATLQGLYMALVPLLVALLFMLGLGDLLRNLYRFFRTAGSIQRFRA